MQKKGLALAALGIKLVLALATLITKLDLALAVFCHPCRAALT